MYKLKIHHKPVSISKFSNYSPQLGKLLKEETICFVLKGRDHYTLICDEQITVKNSELLEGLVKIEKNYCLIEFDQKFGFTEIGVLSSALKPLADAGISILALAIGAASSIFTFTRYNAVFQNSFILLI